MTWTKDHKWECELCHQVTSTPGPWCQLYALSRRDLCRPMAKKWLREADAHGDGSFVNALCQLGRQKWGTDLDW